MTARAPVPFDPSGPLPGPGITVIEASAGTGKTYTLTTLVLRFVADGVPLSSLLAVTFTKMATGELRDRVRSRLVEAHTQLAAVLAGDPGAAAGDEVVADLAVGPADLVELRHQRLADALADFDAATIATTHGFCQLVLHGLGTAGDTVPGVTLLEDPAELIEEVVDDLYLRRNLVHPDEQPPFRLDVARRAAAEAIRNPDTKLVPPPGDDPCGLLTRLAGRARTEVGRRLVEENLLTYDHLLYRLAGTLEDPERGPIACRRLGDRYRIVLVDEFQDTDPVQWTVLRQAFTGEHTRLILIGDPKQAVYAFRGADVHAYLDAAASADAYLTLETNWRADQPLLDAIEALMDPLQFGHDEIVFRSVKAPVGRRDPGLRAGGADAPMRWRLVDDAERSLSMTTKRLLAKPQLRDWVAEDVAGDIRRLLDSDASVREGGRWRPVVPRDVAVLTRTNAQALAVRDALRAAGVPSVVAGLDTVFGSDAADHWLRLLDGLQEPSSRSRAAAVALGPWIGLTTVEAATASEGRWEDVHDRLRRWASVLAGRGIAAVYRLVTVEQGLPGRLLGVEGGERLLTDLGHLAQLLHAEAAAGRLGAPSLRSWLAERIRTAGEEQAESEDRSRRLDSDAEAVQVLTVHRAKGLEFPVVYCPYLWDGGLPDRGAGPVVFHDADDDLARTLDVGCPVPSGPARDRYQDHAAVARSERRGEDLRLLYVALTRARHQVVVWWARTQDSKHSPLGRLLVGRDPGTGAVRDSRGGEPGARQIRGALEVVASRRPGCMSIEVAERYRATGRPAAVDRAGRPGLEVAAFDRSLDQRWRRASYTSITAGVHGGPTAGLVGSEPETNALADEPAEEHPSDARPPAGSLPAGAGAGAGAGAAADESESAGGQASSGGPEPAGRPLVPAERPLLAAVPGGAAVGTFVHRVLEQTDFAAVDLAHELATTIAAVARTDGHAVPGPELGAGLEAFVRTPLGPLLPGVTLADVGRPDRLDELGFELPVAGGENPLGAVTTADLAAVIRRHLIGSAVLAGYPDRLEDPLLETTLRGYLTGSLDLVFRQRGQDGEPRWYLADYKTNWLAPSGVELAAEHYRPSALDGEMQARHYPLQALIYMVALHRYLRWRQPGYDPHRHLGGALYLFVRGMVGLRTPVIDDQPCGVWSWSVPAALVVELSELFEFGAEGSGR
ncbi:MAG TPA: UvrD-helicase domain-containing protein [Acidimicrobiales bacterium]|jgi:exodeoxyribonuclease V beta subunit|nr:UvrD-helicase domain-containing protein [Acidimicrobiales bacterium]